MTLDARFIQPLPGHDAQGWAEYAAADLATLPDGEVPLVVFFGDGLWQHPDPREQGEQPHRREDGSMGYTYRFKGETLAAVQAVQESGRKALAYVNPWRWRKLGGTPDELLALCLELLGEGWDGIYFDGYPVVGKVKSRADDARAAGWLAQLSVLWPGVTIYLHGSGRDKPGRAELRADVVLYGEWGDGWDDPPDTRVLSYAADLLRMGVEPVYAKVSVSKKWFDTFAAMGSVRCVKGLSIDFDRMMKVRRR